MFEHLPCDARGKRTHTVRSKLRYARQSLLSAASPVALNTRNINAVGFDNDGSHLSLPTASERWNAMRPGGGSPGKP